MVYVVQDENFRLTLTYICVCVCGEWTRSMLTESCSTCFIDEVLDLNAWKLELYSAKIIHAWAWAYLFWVSNPIVNTLCWALHMGFWAFIWFCGSREKLRQRKRWDPQSYQAPIGLAADESPRFLPFPSMPSVFSCSATRQVDLVEIISFFALEFDLLGS